MSVAVPSASLQSELLERLTQLPALQQLLTALDRRLAKTPTDHGGRLHRANLLRAMGDLAAARAAYAELAARDRADATIDRPLAILSGERVSWSDPRGPVPFVRIHDFLNAERLERVWRVVNDPAGGLREAQVVHDGSGQVDPATRQAKLLAGAAPLREWFLPLIETTIAGENILPRIGLTPFAVVRRELQVSTHGAGGFFRIHRDAGPKNPLRHVTYIYYFHREPRRFSGGDLLLFDQTEMGERSDATALTRIAPVHNSIVFFPSDRLHAVTRVAMDSDDPMDAR